jgi:penicillin-binding protein 2
MTATLALENGEWKVQWEDGMILPELRGGNRLALELKTPSRADITTATGSPWPPKPKLWLWGLSPTRSKMGAKAACWTPTRV